MRKLFFTLFTLCCLISLAAAATLQEVVQRNEQLPDSKKLHAAVGNFKQPLFWLFLGDSITHGCLHTHGARNFVEHFNEFIRWDVGIAKRKDDLVLNAAASGDAMTDMMKKVDWKLKPYPVDVVFINFATNDARKGHDIKQYERDLVRLIEMVRAKKAIPILMIPNAMSPHHANDLKFHEVIRKVADEKQCLLVDHAGRWHELAKGKAGFVKQLLTDAVHPNTKGQLLMAKTIIYSLGLDKGYKNASVLKLPSP